MAARVQKVVLTSPYPSPRDVADLLRLPAGRVEKLAEELMQFQRNDMRAALGASRRAARKAAAEPATRKKPARKRA
jgi:hypothetical protein